MKKLALSGLLLAATFPLFAASPVATNYDVEVLAFAIQAPEFEGSELWTRTEQPLDTSSAVSPPEQPPSPDFSNFAATLAADGRYRILMTRHWFQATDTRSAVSPTLLTSTQNELIGTLRFYLSKYPHVELSAMFQPSPSTIGDAAPVDYVIREQRRVRNGELSYFDHPRFGIIVRVTPIPAKTS